MAIKQVVISDIGGTELAEGQVAKVRVSGHPALGQRVVELDVGVDEAAKFEQNASDFVYLEVDAPGSGPREVVLDVAAFEKAFPAKADVKGILAGARESLGKPEPQTRRRRRTSSSSNGSAAKVDYTSVDHAGQLHRGRVNEAEAEFVRNNLDRANINRAKLGQPAIDPNDPAEKKRYGF